MLEQRSDVAQRFPNADDQWKSCCWYWAKWKNKLEESKHLDLISGFATCGMCVPKLTSCICEPQLCSKVWWVGLSLSFLKVCLGALSATSCLLSVLLPQRGERWALWACSIRWPWWAELWAMVLDSSSLEWRLAIKSSKPRSPYSSPQINEAVTWGGLWSQTSPYNMKLVNSCQAETLS